VSREERTGVRDLTYSNWHRREFDDDAAMIDLDDIEWCCRCGTVLAVIETARIERTTADPTRFKPALTTMKLARRLNVPGFVLKYRPSVGPCTCGPRGRGHDVGARVVPVLEKPLSGHRDDGPRA
jgi:hypothetical protein